MLKPANIRTSQGNVQNLAHLKQVIKCGTQGLNTQNLIQKKDLYSFNVFSVALYIENK